MMVCYNYNRQFCVFLWFCIATEGIGLLLRSSPEEAEICEGEQLELVCSTTNATFLRWTSLLQTEQGRVHVYSRYISSAGESQQATSFIVNSTSFNVSRLSHQGRLPLQSRLLIKPVTSTLNETKVNCTEVDSINDANIMMVSTTIRVIGESSYSNSHPKVITSVKYGIDNVTVLLEWTPKPRTSYSVNAEPEVIVTSSRSLTTAQLTVPYNTHLNVCIVTKVCAQYTVANIIWLHYAKCGYPIHNSVQVIGYINPSLEGTTVNFSCPTGQILTGPRALTCMGNGEWESDSGGSDFKCNVNCGPPLLPPNGYIVFSNGTTEGSSISFVCLLTHPETAAVVYTTVCNQLGDWEPHPTDICQLVSKDEPMLDAVTITVIIISSISMSILTSIIFLLFGYACGWRQRCKISGSRGRTTSETNTVHESVVPSVTTEKMELKLMKNEAYASLNIGFSQS